jgi:type IV secretory pathway VirD2 relaxase
VPKRTGAQAIVKVGYFRAGRVPGYLQYIERDGTAGPTARDGTTAAQGYSGYIGREGAGEGGQRAELFTWNGQMVDREAFVHRSQGDPRAWTIIVSPGPHDLDMERYVREFMRQLAMDLGRPLDYIAAVHRNTSYTHAHILLRGRDREGHEFRIPRRYFSHDLRQRATDIATRAHELGWVRETGKKPMHTAWSLDQMSRTLARWMTAHAREGRAR